MSRNVSRIRLIFAATTILSAVALASSASAAPGLTKSPPYVRNNAAPPKFDWAKLAAARRNAATPKFDWAKHAVARQAAAFRPALRILGIRLPPKHPGFFPPRPNQPVFVHGIPVFIPGHTPPFVRDNGYRPYTPSYGTSYAATPGQSQSAPGPAATYQALGLVWNNDGAWVVEAASTLEEATNNALTKCNAQYGSCQVSTASVSEQAFACLGVARSAQDTKRLFAARAGSQDQMQANVEQSMSSAGTQGSFEYAACNAASS